MEQASQAIATTAFEAVSSSAYTKEILEGTTSRSGDRLTRGSMLGQHLWPPAAPQRNKLCMRRASKQLRFCVTIQSQAQKSTSLEAVSCCKRLGNSSLDSNQSCQTRNGTHYFASVRPSGAMVQLCATMFYSPRSFLRTPFTP